MGAFGGVRVTTVEVELVGLMWTDVLIRVELRCMSICKHWLGGGFVLTGWGRVWKNSDREFCPWVHIMKMSSMKWNHIKGINREEFR